jgi:hypothetical protein
VHIVEHRGVCVDSLWGTVTLTAVVNDNV